VTDALERFARELPAGTVLFEEGQPGNEMYIVVSGEVEIRRQVGGIERVLAVLPAGEFFGEMAILNGRPRSATAVVRTAARLFVIDGTTFEAMLRARPEIALRMIKALSSRLASANDHVELLLLPTANHRVVQCLRQMAEEQLQLTGPVPTVFESSPAHGPDRSDPAMTLPSEGGPFGQGVAILVPKGAAEIAAQVGLSVDEVNAVLERLRAAQLVLLAEDAGIEGGGYIIPEVGRLLEFLEFLDLRNQFG
jgi:CRP-like cAMP-binding protein